MGYKHRPFYIVNSNSLSFFRYLTLYIPFSLVSMLEVPSVPKIALLFFVTFLGLVQHPDRCENQVRICSLNLLNDNLWLMGLLNGQMLERKLTTSGCYVSTWLMILVFESAAQSESKEKIILLPDSLVRNDFRQLRLTVLRALREQSNRA